MPCSRHHHPAPELLHSQTETPSPLNTSSPPSPSPALGNLSPAFAPAPLLPRVSHVRPSEPPPSCCTPQRYGALVRCGRGCQMPQPPWERSTVPQRVKHSAPIRPSDSPCGRTKVLNVAAHANLGTSSCSVHSSQKVETTQVSVGG